MDGGNKKGAGGNSVTRRNLGKTSKKMGREKKLAVDIKHKMKGRGVNDERPESKKIVYAKGRGGS